MDNIENLKTLKDTGGRSEPMKEKIRLRGEIIGSFYTPNKVERLLDLTLSDLASQLTMEQYWDLGIEMHRLKKDCPNDPNCSFCEEKPIKPTQKPKIEEIDESEMSITDTIDKAEKMILTQKLNEVILAVNGLYEKFDRAK